MDTIKITGTFEPHVYPPDASPGECVAIDVDRFVQSRNRILDQAFVHAVCVEFERSCRARDAMQVVHMDPSWPVIVRAAGGRGVAVLAAANGETWSCVLLLGPGQIAVFVPSAS